MSKVLHDDLCLLARIFSNFRLDPSKLSKRLGVKTAAKLLYVIKLVGILFGGSLHKCLVLHDDLCLLAMKLLQMPASLGSIERIFSNFRLDPI